MWRMPESGAAEALAALLDRSIEAMAAGGPGPQWDRWAVHDAADLWQEQVMPLCSVMLTRPGPFRERRARELLAWMAGSDPVRRRLMADLAAAAGVEPAHLGPQDAPEYGAAQRLATSELRSLHVERTVWFNNGAARDPSWGDDARAFAGPGLPLRWRHRTPERVVDWSRRQPEHAGYDLTRATLTALRVERVAGRWSAALEFDVLMPGRSGRGYSWSEPLHVWVDGLREAAFDSADVEGLRLDGSGVRVGGGALRGTDVTWTYNWFDLMVSRGFGPVQWLWPHGAARETARALHRVLLELRMAGRHRVVAGVPVAGLTATIAGAGGDLLRAGALPVGRRGAALRALTARWRARPALDLRSPRDEDPPQRPDLLAWHAGDELADGRRGDRRTAVYATAAAGDRLHGGEHVGPARLRLRHHADALTFDLEPVDGR
jgi:hypothetical protein